jgi:hypothetical protein
LKNILGHLSKKGLKLPKRATSPFPNSCRPELDTTPVLDDDDASYYQSLIGILRWIVELGRCDLTCESSIMASFMAMPRQGHLDILFHIFGYLKNKHNAELILDPSEIKFDKELFKQENWVNTPYGNTPINDSSDVPELLGKIMKIIFYCDADHAGDLVTRRSRTDFFVYLNNALIYWLSKRQLSIETGSYGSEFTALKQCCEHLKGFKYKLTKIGIPTEYPCYIFGDNKSVLSNSTVPHSTLKKKSCSVAYHYVREGVAHDLWRIEYINTNDNQADMFSKPLYGGTKRNKFVSQVLHHLDG